MRLVLLLLLLVCGRADVIDDFIVSKMESGHIGGLSASILHQDTVLWSHSYGLMEPADTQSNPVRNETIFMLASISKTIMSVAIMELYQKELIQLHDDINVYLPFPVHNPYYPERTITVQMLLTHTSSINDEGYLSNLQNYYVLGDSSVPLDTFLSDYLTPSGIHYNESANYYDAIPGTYYSYSNVGATLAAYLVECVQSSQGFSQSFAEYTEEEIFNPLQMDDSFWYYGNFTKSESIATPTNYNKQKYHSICQYGYPDYPSGALRTSEIQLRRFFGMFINNGTWNDVTLLSPETVQLMSTIPVGLEAEGQALVWYYKRQHSRTLLGHSGGDFGVATDMFFNPQSQIGFIVLTNGDWDQPGFTIAMTQIENFLLDIFDPQETLKNQQDFSTPSALTLKRHSSGSSLFCTRPWLIY